MVRKDDPKMIEHQRAKSTTRSVTYLVAALSSFLALSQLLTADEADYALELH